MEIVPSIAIDPSRVPISGIWIFRRVHSVPSTFNQAGFRFLTRYESSKLVAAQVASNERTNVGLAIVEAGLDQAGPVLPPCRSCTYCVVGIERANIDSIGPNKGPAVRAKQVRPCGNWCFHAIGDAQYWIFDTVTLDKLNADLKRLRCVFSDYCLYYVRTERMADILRSVWVGGTRVGKANEEVAPVIVAQSDAAASDLGN